MSDDALPEWLTEGDDGSVTISFKDMKLKPKFDGTEFSEITMREPSLDEQLAHQKKHKHMGDAERALVADLIEQSPDVVGQLSIRHWRRFERALAFFNFG